MQIFVVSRGLQFCSDLVMSVVWHHRGDFDTSKSGLATSERENPTNLAKKTKRKGKSVSPVYQYLLLRLFNT